MYVDVYVLASLYSKYYIVAECVLHTYFTVLYGTYLIWGRRLNMYWALTSFLGLAAEEDERQTPHLKLTTGVACCLVTDNALRWPVATAAVTKNSCESISARCDRAKLRIEIR